MKNDQKLSEAGEQYAAAHAAHYTAKHLHQALELYTSIVASHPEEPEAGYAHSQIQNIVNSVVSKQDLLDAQLALALARTTDEPIPGDGPATSVT